MNYLDLRPIIKSGDVLAWSEGGWGSLHDIECSIVKMVTGSEFNHVGVAYVVGGRVFVVEAVVPLIRIFPLSKLTPFYYIRTPENWWTPRTEEFLLSRVGLPYSKWEAIKSFFSKDTDGELVWECAKLVNRALMEFDARFDNINDTPVKTIDFLMKNHDGRITYVS